MVGMFFFSRKRLRTSIKIESLAQLLEARSLAYTGTRRTRGDRRLGWGFIIQPKQPWLARALSLSPSLSLSFQQNFFVTEQEEWGWSSY